MFQGCSCIKFKVFCYCRGLDVTPITLALSGAASYPRGCQALASMLSRGAPNPADMTVVCTTAILLNYRKLGKSEKDIFSKVASVYSCKSYIGIKKNIFVITPCRESNLVCWRCVILLKVPHDYLYIDNRYCWKKNDNRYQRPFIFPQRQILKITVFSSSYIKCINPTIPLR